MKRKPIRGRLTPLDAADLTIHETVGDHVDDALLARYEAARDAYLHMRWLYHIVRVLFYASLISTVATAFGLEQLQVIQSLQSYIGTPALLLLLLLTRYLGRVRRERYEVRREHLIADAVQHA